MSTAYGIVDRFADAVTVVIGRRIGPEENFFDAGLDSVTLETLHGHVTRGAAGHFPITDLFAHPNLRALGRRWSERAGDGREAMPGEDRRVRAVPAVGPIGRRRRELRTGRGGDGS